MTSQKTHTLSNGKCVHVYDGFIPADVRSQAFLFISNSLYKIGWSDGVDELAARHRYLYSTYSNEDNTNALILPKIKATPVFDHVRDLKLEKAIVNLSTPSDTYFAHCHVEKKVVLYYANLYWHSYWHGETLFYSDDLSEIELAIRYTPGRIIVFDGTTPHAIRPQSSLADNFRFTYAMVFD